MRRWDAAACAVVLVASLPAFAAAQTVQPDPGTAATLSPEVTLEDLKVHRRLAVAELQQAKARRTQTWTNLHGARQTYRLAHELLQERAASLWMGIPNDAGVDADHVSTLKAAIAMARTDVEFSGLDLLRARGYLSHLGGRIALARQLARRARIESVAQRMQQAERRRASSTIHCPVAAASAIYADFGAPRSGGPHRGIDVPAPTGTPVLATWHARVLETPVGGWMGLGVILQDGAGNTWWYAHLSSVSVEVGQIVSRGGPLGTVGSTGNSTGPHLHFEIHARGVSPIDPYPFVSKACGVHDPLTHQERVAAEASTSSAN